MLKVVDTAAANAFDFFNIATIWADATPEGLHNCYFAGGRLPVMKSHCEPERPGIANPCRK